MDQPACVELHNMWEIFIFIENSNPSHVPSSTTFVSSPNNLYNLSITNLHVDFKVEKLSILYRTWSREFEIIFGVVLLISIYSLLAV